MLKTLHALPDPAALARAATKVKRHVLPLFVIMFIVNYIDRVNIGFVRSHLETDLGIGAAAYSLGAGLFKYARHIDSPYEPDNWGEAISEAQVVAGLHHSALVSLGHAGFNYG